MPLYILVALVFIGIALILLFLFSLLLPKKPALMERLETLVSYMDKGAPPVKPPSTWQKILSRLGKNIPIRPQDYGKYMKVLIAGGIRKEKYSLFMGSKILLSIFLPLFYLTAYGIPMEKNFAIRSLMTIAFAITGFLIPSFWLSYKVRKRQTQIFHELPNVLDLMTVCVEAGLGLDAAMVKLSEDPQFRKSPLATEMRIAVQETLAGKPRFEALRDMGDRTMVEDLKSFSAMLIQTERFGTSIAQALRIHADTLRNARIQRAQEEAAKTTVKIVFPLIFFILPAIFIVVLLPGLIRMARVF